MVQNPDELRLNQQIISFTEGSLPVIIIPVAKIVTAITRKPAQ
jgi:hypothetical protein